LGAGYKECTRLPGRRAARWPRSAAIEIFRLDRPAIDYHAVGGGAYDGSMGVGVLNFFLQKGRKTVDLSSEIA